MSWTLTEPTSGLNLAPAVGSGDISITEVQETGVFWPKRGSSPTVQQGPLRIASISTPPWDLTAAQLATLRAIVALGRRVVLTDDLGGSWPCRISGGLTTVLLDTADRATAPRYRVTVSLVGVV